MLSAVHPRLAEAQLWAVHLRREVMLPWVGHQRVAVPQRVLAQPLPSVQQPLVQRLWLWRRLKPSPHLAHAANRLGECWRDKYRP